MRAASRYRWGLFFILALVLAALFVLPGIAGAAGKGSSGAKPKVVKELTDLRTENSKTYLLSNGARQLEIYGGPIQFKDDKGSWKEIDTSLVPAADGSLASAATPANVKLAKKDKGAPVVSLAYQGASLELSMNGHDFSTPTVKGNSASYPEASAALDSGAAGTTAGPSPESTTTEATKAGKSATRSTAAGLLQPLASPTTAAGVLSPFAELAAVTTDTVSSTTTSEAAEDTTTSDTSSSTTTSDSTSTTLESTTTTAPAAGSEVSLSYQVTANGIKENIILASADAPGTYTFTVKHPGLTCKKDNTGQWGFYDTEENPYPLFALGNIEVYDSSVSVTGDPAYCNAATMTVVPGADESTVTYTVPQAWLSDPARVFPVTIDPTVTLRKNSPPGSLAPDTWISSGYPDTSYGSNNQVPVGYPDSNYKWVTGLFKFTLPTDLTSGGYVQSAHFQVYQYYQSTSTAQVARASAMTQDWSESSTYNSLGGHTWFGSDTRSAATTSAQAQWIDFDFTTTVQKWADGSRPNYGFTMYQSQSDYNQSPKWWRRVYTSDYTGDSSLWPKLVITYTAPISVATYGATGTNVPTGPNYSDDTTAFQNAINAVDPNGGVVTVPVGTYYVSGLSLTSSNVVLRGAGTSSIILPNPNPHPVQPIGQMVQIGGPSAVSNITVRDLYLRVPQGGYGVRMSGSGGGSGITVSGLALAGGGDSAATQALSVASGFSNLSIQNNDLTTVSAVPVGVSLSGAGVSVSGNMGPYQPYRADFFQGTDQYDTAIRLSKARFPQGAPAAVLVAGDTWQEAMTAAPLAHAYGGPVVLTQSSGLDSRTLAELQRLGPTTVFVIGLTTTISNAVADALPAASVTRLAGPDIYGTAAAVATQVKTKLGSVSDAVLVASDYYNTGISVGAVAGYNGFPVLFSPRNGSVPTTTVNEIKSTLGLSAAAACGINPSVTISGVSLDYQDVSSPYDPAGVAEAFNDNYCVGGVINGNPAQAIEGVATYTNYSDALALGSYIANLSGSGVLYLTNDDTAPPITDQMLRLCPQVRRNMIYVGRPNLWMADENSGLWNPVAPHHTSYDFDSFADHQIEATLDQAALRTSTTDLAVASFGPQAALDRAYSSTRTDSRYFAPGWIFSFDRRLEPETDGMHYVDEKGDDYVFLQYGAVWISPPGFTGRLRGGDAGNTSDYYLTLPGGNTLTFDPYGTLLSEADANGNTVTYTWGYDTNSVLTSLTIAAANGQHIAVTFQDIAWKSCISQATYSTSNGTRTVTYATAGPWNVTYAYTGTPTTASHSLTYAYTSGLLTGLTATAFAGGQDATENYSYDANGKLTGVTFPDYGTNADAHATIDNGSGTATVHRWGRVYASGSITGATGTEVTQTFTWNSAGATLTMTNPKASGDSTQTWNYTYTPYTNWMVSETSPLGKEEDWSYNNHGNLTSQTDWHTPGQQGATSIYTYPDKDLVVQATVTALITADAADGYDANTTLHTTDYNYIAIGRGTAVDKAGWRFQNLAIPQGATITDVQFKLYAYYDVNGSLNNLNTQLTVEDADDSGPWTVGGHEPRLATPGSGSINWKPANIYGQPEWKAGNSYTCDSSDAPSADPGLKNAVQGVIDRTGWAPGHSLSVLWLDNGTVATNLLDAADYKNGSATAPTLTITYYVPNAAPDPTRDEDKTAVDPAGSLITNYYDTEGNLPRDTQQLSAAQTGDTTTVFGAQTAGGATYYGAPVQTRKVMPNNGLVSPSAFDNAAWTKSHAGAFADVMDSPLDGSTTADKIVEDNSSGYHFLSQALSSSALTRGKVYRFSCYVQAAGRTQVGILFSSANGTFKSSPQQAQAVFDLAAGAVLSGKTCQAAGIESAGGGWYHIWADEPATASATGVVEILTALSGNLSYAGQGHATVVSSDPGFYAVSAYSGEVVATDSSGQNFAANGEPTQTAYKGVVRQDGGDGSDLTVTQSFDNFGNSLTKTDGSNQVQETDTYDLAGRLLTSTGPSFTATVGAPTSTQIITHHFYDAWGHETESYETSTGEAQTQADWTLTTYDKAGRVSTVQKKLSPSGSVQSTVTSTYDGIGRLVSSADTTVSGEPALTSCDARGNEVLSWAGGACTLQEGYLQAKAIQHLTGSTPAYDALNDVLSTTNPGDTAATTYAYYDNGRLKKETRPDGYWVRSYYDGAGNVIHTFDSVMQAKYPLESEDSPTHYLTTASFDLDGNCTSSTDGNGLTTNFTYDLLGNILTEDVPGQPSALFNYNQQDEQLKAQDSDATSSTLTFDEAGRVTSETTAGNTSSWNYDAAGHVIHRADPEDRETDYTYDWFGHTNRETETLPGTPRTTVKDTMTAYDSLGRVATITDNNRHLTHSFTYPLNTAASTTDAQTVGSSGSDQVSTNLTVGADGYETSRDSTITSNPQIPNLTRTVNTRDSGERVTKATLQTGTSRYIYAQYGYDSSGRIVRQWGPDANDGSGYLNAARTGDPTYTYDSTSGLKTGDNLQLQTVGSGVQTTGVLSGGYTYDQNGRLDSSTVNTVSENDDFDSAGNITSIGGGVGFTYDHNRLATRTLSGTPNFYYFFDTSNPSQEWRTVQASTNNQNDLNRTTFAYTKTGRLKTYTQYSGGSVTLTGNYTYDGQSQRTASDVNNLAGGWETVTNYSYEGLSLMSLSATQTGTGATSWRISYLYDESGRPYAGIYRNPATSTSPIVFGMVTTDRGDVVELVDAAGNPFAAYRYDAWGNPLGSGNVATGIWSQQSEPNNPLITAQQATDIANRQVLRYSGYCFDSESGLYYASARSYDPMTRQFLSKDPAKSDGEQSAYEYCSGNPVTNMDPSGLYDRDAAAKYADKWALGTNPDEGRAGRAHTNDCTDFVSQCIHAGGKPCVRNGLDYKSDSVWFSNYDAATRDIPFASSSYTWAAANNLRHFLDNYSGWESWTMIFDEGSLSTFDLPPDIYRYGARKGDAVAFDFNSNGTTDHWAFIAVAEYNTTTRVDAHNTDHCHAVWNLFGYINHKKYPDPHCTVIHFSD